MNEKLKDCRAMRNIVKALFAAAVFLLCVAAGSANTEASVIRLGQTVSGTLETVFDYDFYIPEKHMPVRVTLQLGAAEQNEYSQLYTQYRGTDLSFSADNDFEIRDIQPGSRTVRTFWISDEDKFGVSVIISPGMSLLKVPFTLLIEDARVWAKELVLDKSRAIVYEGNSIQLTATKKNEDEFLKAIQWKSSNPKIARVDDEGNVTGVKPGKCTISAITNGGPAAKCKVRVKKVPFRLNKQKATVYANHTVQLRAESKIKGVRVNSVRWKSSNNKVALVSKKGEVCGVKPGRCVIYAITAGGIRKKCVITVKKEPPLMVMKFSCGSDSAGSIEPYLKILNNTGKTIKYIYITVKYYNRVGDPVYDEITGTNYCNLTMIGPVRNYYTASVDYDPVGYSDTAYYVAIKSVKVKFMDGSVKTFPIRKTAKIVRKKF